MKRFQRKADRLYAQLYAIQCPNEDDQYRHDVDLIAISLMEAYTMGVSERGE